MERPRWTRNDEQKYRRTIQRVLGDNKRTISVLKGQQARIESLIPLVTSIQDGMRAEMSLHEAENIRLFTYVTIFFLPVGLASSIFSMAGVPDRKLIISMVLTAVIALFVTFAVLYTLFFGWGPEHTAKVSGVLASALFWKKDAKDQTEHAKMRGRVERGWKRMKEVWRNQFPTGERSKKAASADDVEPARIMEP
ncbi:MAG: hypothetical protein Q9164_007308 [Protoblastenia rupestris]